MRLELSGIRLTAGAGLRLQPGETVSLDVVRRVGGHRWAVTLGGRPATAWSPVDLVPGRPLRVRVDRAGDPASGVPALLKPVELSRSALLEWLRRVGLPPDALSERVVAALLNHRAALDPRLIAQVRRAASGRQPADARLVRLLVLLLDRGLDPREAGAGRVLSLLAGGERRGDAEPRQGSCDRHPGGDPGTGEGPPREGRPPVPRQPPPNPARAVAEALREALEGAGQDRESALQVFNHLASRHDHWMVVPFRMSGAGPSVDGSLRLLYDPLQRRVQRFVLEAGLEDGTRWAFALHRDPGSAARLQVLHGGPQGRAAGPVDLPRLVKKLHNLGVEVDDTWIEYGDFDGFSLPGEAVTLQSVDTVR